MPVDRTMLRWRNANAHRSDRCARKGLRVRFPLGALTVPWWNTRHTPLKMERRKKREGGNPSGTTDYAHALDPFDSVLCCAPDTDRICIHYGMLVERHALPRTKMNVHERGQAVLALPDH